MIIENETGQRVSPADALVLEIDRRRTAPAVALSGLGPVLDVLRAYITEQEAEREQVRNALGLLAAVGLSRDSERSEVQRKALEQIKAWAGRGRQ